MRTRLLLAALLLAVVGLLVAGCGSGGGGGTGGGSLAAGASLVRAGVIGFVSVDTDTGSGQWRQLEDLAQKFPGRDRAIAQLERAFTRHGVDYSRDVKPALGPELDLAFVRVGTTLTTQAVALTKPDDPGKFKALVAKLNASDSSGQQAVYREVDGWYALADSQRTITGALKGDRTSLAADATFKEALGKLSDDALVEAFVDGAQLNRFAADAGSASRSSFDTSSLGLDSLKYAAVSVAAEDDGLRLQGASKGGNLGGSDFSSSLLGGIPGDAFAVLDFQGGSSAQQLDTLRSSPQGGAALRRVQAMLGVTPDELLALLRGEIAVYARGVGIPELTIALDESDPTSALATLDKLFARLAASSGGRVQPGTQGGHDVKTVDLGQLALHYGALGSKVLITSGVNGIAAYGGSGDRFPDSADFKEAKVAAGMPDSTGGFAYVDLKDTIPLLEGLAGLSGHSPPPEVTENLRPLRSLLAWGEGSGDTRTFDAFLQIK